eukprot:Tbor_TRINITY_DN2934_c0_g1::TRINITY_DN2934_c0_g1_i1::g.1107::m.1107
MSFDNAVTSLMGHINDVETRRRMVMMQLKEVETHLEHLSEDGSSTQKQLNHLREKETSSHTRLYQLMDEQRALNSQYNEGIEIIKRAQVEEPLLISHAEEKINNSNSRFLKWEDCDANLKNVQKKWNDESLVGPLLQSITQCESQLAVLLKDEQELLNAAAATQQEADRQKLQDAIDSSSAANDILSPSIAAATVTADTIASLKKSIFEFEKSALDEQKSLERSTVTCSREVKELEARNKEMKQWMDESALSQSKLESHAAKLQSSHDSGVCVKCMSLQ